MQKATNGIPLAPAVVLVIAVTFIALVSSTLLQAGFLSTVETHNHLTTDEGEGLILCSYEDASNEEVLNVTHMDIDFVAGIGNNSYTWTYNGNVYALNFELNDEEYAYYVDYEIARYMAVINDRDNLRTFITHDDSVVVYVAGCLDNLSKQGGLSKAEEASMVLTFVQTMPYSADYDTHLMSDYWSFPVETLHDGTGDCEDKSILYSSLLMALEFDTVLLIYDSHIAVGVNCDNITGWYYTIENVKYYYCEPTVLGWNIGEMPLEYDEGYVLVISAKLTAPIDFIVEGGDGQITLAWKKPSGGGSEIDFYVVYQNGIQVAITENTSIIIKGLTNGQAYSFTVAAHNAAGMGEETSPVLVKPTTPSAENDNLMSRMWIPMILVPIVVLIVVVLLLTRL